MNRRFCSVGIGPKAIGKSTYERSTAINSCIIFGQLTRISPDRNRPTIAHADLIDIGSISQEPVEFALIGFKGMCDRLMECQVGDLVVVTGHISLGSRSMKYSVTVIDIQRVAFEDEPPPAEDEPQQP